MIQLAEKMPSNMDRIEDVLATELLVSIIKCRCIESRIVDHSKVIPPETYKILVWSAKGNQRSASFMEQVPYEFRIEGQSTPYFVDIATGIEFNSPSDITKINADLALVGRYTDNKAPKKSIHNLGDPWGRYSGSRQISGEQKTPEQSKQDHWQKRLLSHD